MATQVVKFDEKQLEQIISRMVEERIEPVRERITALERQRDELLDQCESVSWISTCHVREILGATCPATESGQEQP